MTGTGGAGDLYELLGVRRDATPGEITRAYHRRARALHPDTQPCQAGEPARFRELEEAYRVLHDPARRAAYDQELRQATVRPPLPPGGAARPRHGRAADWPVARAPGAVLWAGPAQVTPPGTSALPGVTPAGLGWRRRWLQYPAGDPGAGPGWGWPW